MEKFKVGDRVETHYELFGVITGRVPIELFGMDWMVLTDGDPEPYPYYEKELRKCNDSE